MTRGRLEGVTVSGADGGVRVGELLALSEEFPFVEWGILVSRSRAGTARYPTRGWQARLEGHAHRIKLSLHFCGAVAREALGGSQSDLPRTGARRVQLNGWAPGAANLEALWRNALMFGIEFILQVRREEDLPAAVAEAAAIERAAVLFDPSGGTGVKAGRWPALPKGLRHMGYAGGITPESIDHDLAEIATARVLDGERYWVDFESGARDSDDRFDLGRVRKALVRGNDWVPL